MIKDFTISDCIYNLKWVNASCPDLCTSFTPWIALVLRPCNEDEKLHNCPFLMKNSIRKCVWGSKLVCLLYFSKIKLYRLLMLLRDFNYIKIETRASSPFFQTKSVPCTSDSKFQCDPEIGSKKVAMNGDLIWILSASITYAGSL